MKKLLTAFCVFALALVCIFVVPATAEAANVDDLTFRLNEDKKGYTVTACEKMASGALEIPETYKGKPVTAIADYAFDNKNYLTGVVIPDSVVSIGDWAFYSCDKLSTVTLGDGVTAIGNSAFRSCKRLTGITIGDSVKTIGSSAFRACKAMTAATIGDGVTKIGSYAFDDCNILAKVIIGDSVTSIGTGAFSQCYKLTGLTIGKSVKTIGNKAFYLCYLLTKVTLPDSVKTIGSGAFSDCYKLKTVIAGNSLTTVKADAFKNCQALARVYFYGTKAQWKDVTISATGNDTLLDAKVSYRTKADIVTQPKSITATNGKTVKLTVKAVGDGVQYAWYYCRKGATKYTQAASTKNVLNIKMAAKWDRCKVYCMVTDKYGNTVKSNVVTLKMK